MKTQRTASEPDWRHWRSMLSAALWEAVSLSLNIEPSTLPGFDMGLRRLEFDDCDSQFRERLKIACNHLQYGQLYSHPQPGDVRFKQVLLSDFASWAMTMEWEIPKSEFEKFSKPRSRIEAKKSNWPWGERTTTLLNHLAEAANLWSNYNRANPRTAPTNKQVIAFLTDRGVSERTAEVMATILRDDNLPTGPRK